MEQKRIEWVDTARFFAMLAVMTNHTQFSTDHFDSFVTPFYLNIFSFVAGYVYCHRAGFSRFFRKKVQQLFIPWLCLSVLSIVSAGLFSLNRHAPVATRLFENLLQIHYRNDEMWYVAALFAAFLPFYFVVGCYERDRGGKGRRGLLLLAGLFALVVLCDSFVMFVPAERVPGARPGFPAALPWHLEYLPNMLFYMLLGYLFRRHGEEGFDRRNRGGVGLALLALYYLLDMVLPLRVGGIYGFPRILFQHLCALTALCALIALCKKLPSNAFVRTVGQNTILYYGLHGKVESVVQWMIGRTLPGVYALRWSGTHLSAVIAVAIALLVGVLLLPVIWLIRRYLPFLAGKSRRRAAG